MLTAAGLADINSRLPRVFPRDNAPPRLRARSIANRKLYELICARRGRIDGVDGDASILLGLVGFIGLTITR